MRSGKILKESKQLVWPANLSQIKNSFFFFLINSLVACFSHYPLIHPREKINKSIS